MQKSGALALRGTFWMSEIDSGQEAAIKGDRSGSQRQRRQYNREARRQGSACTAGRTAAFERAVAGMMIAAVRRGDCGACGLGHHGSMVMMR